ncbi:MAG: hypothetical protein II998_08025 [Clostridia bacterium]|nr:hypothetical protein [Clostridia bacterium]
MKVVVGEPNFSDGISIVALRTNGTINYLEDLTYGSTVKENSKAVLFGLSNIVDIACSDEYIAVLKDDGTVFTSEDSFRIGKELFEDAGSWTDIVAIDCGREHLVGLKADGTVVSAGTNDKGQCNVLGWSNVSKIYAYDDTTIAIRKDGTALVSGEIGNYSKLAKEKNIKDVFCDYRNLADVQNFEVLRNDGTISATNFAKVKDGEVVGLGGEYTEIDITALLKLLGYTNKITSFKVAGGSAYYFIDEFGDFYSLTDYSNSFKPWKLEKLQENIVGFALDKFDYYAWDENGRIWSDAYAFTSDDWILTTNITYNGEKIDSDVAPYVKDGRTLAPIRAILEALGMTVNWDGTTQTATAVKADVSISITINSNIAIVNGEQKMLDVPAEITNGRTFVPVRFFGEALGMNVDWDGYTKTVIIESK